MYYKWQYLSHYENYSTLRKTCQSRRGFLYNKSGIDLWLVYFYAIDFLKNKSNPHGVGWLNSAWCFSLMFPSSRMNFNNKMFSHSRSTASRLSCSISETLKENVLLFSFKLIKQIQPFQTVHNENAPQ